MKKYLSAVFAIIAAFIFLTTHPVGASNVTLLKQDDSASLDINPPNPPPQPAMFKITGKNAVVYLFGSMHMLSPDMKWRTKLFDYALAKADVIWLESTLLEMSNPVLMIDNARSAVNSQKDLTDILTKEELARVEKAARSQNIDIMEYSNLHPWVISDILQGARYQKDVKKDASKEVKARPGVEMIIEGMAMGKPIRALENTRRHVMLFSSLSPDDEKALLMHTVDEIEQSKQDDLDAMQKAWSSGDLVTLDRIDNIAMEKNTPGLFKVMMLKRNREMVDGIIKQLQGNQTNFVAVGAAHLSGDQSVVSLLEKEGYHVQRIYSPDEPIASTTWRKNYRPNYRGGAEVAHYLNVALRKDTDEGSGKFFLNLSMPRVVNGCVEISPILYEMRSDEDAVEIDTGMFFVNIHPWPNQDGCGSANKLIMVNIPFDIASLKKDKTKTLRLNFPGGTEIYTLSYEDGKITLDPPNDPKFFRPEMKKLTLSGV